MTDKNIKVSYDDFRKGIRELSFNIHNSDYQPDAILCIARGGLLIGGQLSYDLDIKMIGSINIEYYTSHNTTLDAPKILKPSINLNEFKDKNILIADDVLDTGETMKSLINLVKPMVKDFKIVSLFKKNKSIIQPDFYWKEVLSSQWIFFPWSSLPPVSHKVSL